MWKTPIGFYSPGLNLVFIPQTNTSMIFRNRAQINWNIHPLKPRFFAPSRLFSTVGNLSPWPCWCRVSVGSVFSAGERWFVPWNFGTIRLSDCLNTHLLCPGICKCNPLPPQSNLSPALTGLFVLVWKPNSIKNHIHRHSQNAVSYTHLTLPTILRV